MINEVKSLPPSSKLIINNSKIPLPEVKSRPLQFKIMNSKFKTNPTTYRPQVEEPLQLPGISQLRLNAQIQELMKLSPSEIDSLYDYFP